MSLSLLTASACPGAVLGHLQPRRERRAHMDTQRGDASALAAAPGSRERRKTAEIPGIPSPDNKRLTVAFAWMLASQGQAFGNADLCIQDGV